jgi:hypothetical protein
MSELRYALLLKALFLLTRFFICQRYILMRNWNMYNVQVTMVEHECLILVQ